MTRPIEIENKNMRRLHEENLEKLRAWVAGRPGYVYALGVSAGHSEKWARKILDGLLIPAKSDRDKIQSWTGVDLSAWEREDGL